MCGRSLGLENFWMLGSKSSSSRRSWTGLIGALWPTSSVCHGHPYIGSLVQQSASKCRKGMRHEVSKLRQDGPFRRGPVVPHLVGAGRGTRVNPGWVKRVCMAGMSCGTDRVCHAIGARGPGFVTGCAVCDSYDQAVTDEFHQEFGSARCLELVPYLWRSSDLRLHAHCAGFIAGGCCPHCDGADAMKFTTADSDDPMGQSLCDQCGEWAKWDDVENNGELPPTVSPGGALSGRVGDRALDRVRNFCESRQMVRSHEA